MPTLSMGRKIELVNEWLSQQIDWLNEHRTTMTREQAIENFEILKSDHRDLLRATGIVTN